MWYWVLSQHWLGAEPQAAHFTQAVLAETLLQMQQNKDYKEATEKMAVSKTREVHRDVQMDEILRAVCYLPQ